MSRLQIKLTFLILSSLLLSIQCSYNDKKLNETQIKRQTYTRAEIIHCVNCEYRVQRELKHFIDNQIDIYIPQIQYLQSPNQTSLIMKFYHNNSDNTEEISNENDTYYINFMGFSHVQRLLKDYGFEISKELTEKKQRRLDEEERQRKIQEEKKQKRKEKEEQEKQQQQNTLKEPIGSRQDQQRQRTPQGEKLNNDYQGDYVTDWQGQKLENMDNFSFQKLDPNHVDVSQFSQGFNAGSNNDEEEDEDYHSEDL